MNPIPRRAEAELVLNAARPARVLEDVVRLSDMIPNLRIVSDWTNSEPMGTFAQTVNLVHEFVASRGREAKERFFWKKSAAADRGAPRTSRQRQLAT